MGEPKRLGSNWNIQTSHPKINRWPSRKDTASKNGPVEVTCPYCGTKWVLSKKRDRCPCEDGVY